MIVRNDVPAGVAGAMILHAAGETGPAAPGTIAVLLAASSEALLRELALEPDAHLFVESDGEYAGQALSVGFPPTPNRRRNLRRLPLWRGGTMHP